MYGTIGNSLFDYCCTKEVMSEGARNVLVLSHRHSFPSIEIVKMSGPRGMQPAISEGGAYIRVERTFVNPRSDKLLDFEV